MPQVAPTTKTRALIIGGGLVGLTTGIALRRAGFDVTVYEREPELRTVGAGITLWENALNIYDVYGFGRELAASGGSSRAIRFIAEDGTAIGWTELDELREGNDTNGTFIHRHLLSERLIAALGSEHVVYGARIEGVEQDGNEVKAYFADGTQDSGDLLVGADGIWSTVRRVIDPSAVPAFANQVVWRGLVPIVGEEPLPIATPTSSSGLRGGYVPVGNGQLYWYVGKVGASPFPHDADPKAEVLKEVGHWPHLAPLIEATPDEALGVTDIFAMPRLRAWRDRRIVLAGDAAHALPPHIGIGACLGIEDAYVLADRLATLGLESGLVAYETERMARAGVCFAKADEIAQLSGPVYGAALRDLLLWALDTAPIPRGNVG